jgi:ABC-2 type transport system permease protein
MSQAAFIARKDRHEFLRDRRLLIAALLVIALALASLFLAQQRVAAYERDRVIAEQADRETWLNQGARNPHGAAHFNTWAFRPLTSMTLLDPGLTAHAGSAIWMEAHAQNPGTARAAEDQAGVLDLGTFSISWVLQNLAPLLVFVIAAGLVARERERGTLKAIAASGGLLRTLPQHKAQSVLQIALMIFAPLLVAAVVIAMTAPTQPAADETTRLVLWAFAHLIYLAIAACIGAAVSASSRSVDRALLALVTLWLIAVPLAPRLAVTAAEAFAPLPSSRIFLEQINNDLGEADVFDPEDPATIALQQSVMQRYGVTRLEDLPVSFAGIQLDEAEKHGDAVFDRRFGERRVIEDRQRDIMRMAALVSPLVALQNVSTGLAGTDAFHQRAFADQAETHRRVTVGLLNADLIANGAGSDFDYVAPEALWAEIPPFEYRAPTLAESAAALAPDAAILLAWIIAGLFFLHASGSALARSKL